MYLNEHPEDLVDCLIMKVLLDKIRTSEGELL